jgi:hypothetical protein
MSMFYKQLFRVVADDDGHLHKYDDDEKRFDASEVITADGYPKLVCSTHLSREHRERQER